MGTLGQRLAQNIDTERRAARDSAAAWEQQRTDEARKKFQTARTFFEEAKTFFTQAIMSGAATKDVFIQVGGARFANGRDTHREFDAILEGYRASDHKRGPDSLYDAKRFGSLWHEFQQWAKDEGLTARWVNDHDGGGMESWWVLRVEPLAPLKH